MSIKFKDLRECISRIDPVSICMEDASYENYFFVRDVPASHDDLYVYGIGIIESEFPPFEQWSGEGPAWDGDITSPIEFKQCLEIILHKEPR